MSTEKAWRQNWTWSESKFRAANVESSMANIHSDGALHTPRRSMPPAAPPPRRTTTLGEHRCTVGTMPNFFELFLFNRLTFICHYHFYHSACVCGGWLKVCGPELALGLSTVLPQRLLLRHGQTCAYSMTQPKFTIASKPLFCRHSPSFPFFHCPIVLSFQLLHFLIYQSMPWPAHWPTSPSSIAHDIYVCF